MGYHFRVEIALNRAEVIREGTKALKIRLKGTLLPEVSMSLGVAVAPIHATTVDELIHSADTALYQAKREGRDRVVLAGQSAEPESRPEKAKRQSGNQA